MSASGKWVHWGDGLFLQPHHFQVLQRRVIEQATSDRSLAMPYAYGLIEATLSADAISKRQVRYSRLKAVMPSGTVVDYPSGAELTPLDVSGPLRNGSPVVVLLAVPLWDEARANATDGSEGKALGARTIYSVAEEELPDENTGGNRQPVALRRVNARLVMAGDNTAGMETIPLLRVVPGKNPETGEEDKRFVPPCLLMSGSRFLADTFERIAARVDNERTSQVLRIQGAGITPDLFRMKPDAILRLMILNKYAARLRTLARAPALTPLTAYLELRSLLSELAALFPKDDPWRVADYRHEEPAVAFAELDIAILRVLEGDETSEFTTEDFVPEGRLLVCSPSTTELTGAQRLYLAVRSSLTPDRVQDIVEDRDRFKFMSHTRAWDPEPGVMLREDRAPHGIPMSPDVRFFRLLIDMDQDSENTWEAIRTECAIAINWPGMESSDFKLTLYMVKS